MLTSYAEDNVLFAAIEAGAAGYVLKQAGGQAVVRALQAVAEGQSLLDPALTARVFAQPENQARQLLALREAALAISANLSLADTLKHIATAAANLADARYAALGVPDESGAYLAEFITTGPSAKAEARIGHRPRGHGILGVILRDGQSPRLRDLHEHPRSYGFPPNHPPMTSFLGVPINRKGERLGNLYLTDKRSAEEFTDDDQRLSVVEERQRIGMDLRDGIIQSIYAVGLTLEYVMLKSGMASWRPRSGCGQRWGRLTTQPAIFAPTFWISARVASKVTIS